MTTGAAADIAERHARFWARVDRTGDCWTWTAGRSDGYGVVRFAGRDQKAHRVAWQLERGPIPRGIDVLHSCDNPPCCNPAHLFLGTNHDNVIDRHAKGRSKNLFAAGELHPARRHPGEAHWCAKLSAQEVSEIRRMRGDGEKITTLAAAFGVNHGTISRIARREWRKEVA